jgi:uncharacterized protein
MDGFLEVKMSSDNFLELARQGKNQWWRYLIGILSILACWLVSNVIVVAIAFVYWMATTNLSSAADDAVTFAVWLQKPDTIVYIFLNLTFILPLFSIFIFTRLLHQRPVGTLISAQRSLNWKRIFTGFWVWGLLSALMQIPLFLMNHQAYQITFEPLNWFVLVVVALILTPLQTSAEEFFFRSYLLQGMGLLVKNRLALSVLNGILFAIPHLSNPEMARDPALAALNYLSMGIFLAYITLRDQSLDLALGTHAANNLYIFLFVNTTDSVIPTKAIITILEPEHPAISLLVFVLIAGMFNFLLFSKKSKQILE